MWTGLTGEGLQGIAYVEFSSQAGLQAAIAMDKHEVQGKKLSVARSAPPGGPRAGRGGLGRGDQQQSGGRGGRGDFRGRGPGRGRGGDGGEEFEARQVQGGRGRLGQGGRGRGGRPGRGREGRGGRSNSDFRSMLLGGR